MNIEDVEKAQKLKQRIKEYEYFIFVCEKVWKGKLTVVKEKYLFGAIGYGCFSDTEIILPTDLKEEVLNVLKKYVDEMKNEIEEL